MWVAFFDPILSHRILILLAKPRIRHALANFISLGQQREIRVKPSLIATNQPVHQHRITAHSPKLVLQVVTTVSENVVSCHYYIAAMCVENYCGSTPLHCIHSLSTYGFGQGKTQDTRRNSTGSTLFEARTKFSVVSRTCPNCYVRICCITM